MQMWGRFSDAAHALCATPRAVGERAMPKPNKKHVSFPLSIFLSLLEAADLKELLTQPGDWTLFVPTNDAFKGMTSEEKEILIRKWERGPEFAPGWQDLTSPRAPARTAAAGRPPRPRSRVALVSSHVTWDMRRVTH